MERGFGEASALRSLEAARLCIVATTVTSLSFVPFDLMVLPVDRLVFFLGDRLLIALACLMALIALARGRGYRRITAIAYTHQYAFFTLNALVFAHPMLERHGAVLLPLIPITLLMMLPGSFRAAALVCAFAPGISLVFWGILRPQPEAPHDLFIIAMLIVIAYVVGALARCQFNRMRREEYRHIERERQANQILLEAKEAAEAGSRAKADFLAVMSHEIRTPLAGMLGMVRLVLDGAVAAEDRRRLELACQSAEGLRSILDDVLDISRLESGRIAFESEPFPLRETIEGVAALMGVRAREKGIGFTLALAPDLPDWVAGDSARLRQVLFNLIGNAVKFTEAGSVLVGAEVENTADGVEVEISVTDTGIGMDEEQQSGLFQAFAQAGASINRRFGGTGLGLVICKKLVEGMGGSIGFSSVPRQGSRFHVRLPLAVAGAKAAEPPPVALGIASLSVLLAEDNPINSEVAQAYLNKAGHHVTVAVDGAEAVELARRGGFDLILMDMRMPKVDGLEAARRIRALPGPRGEVPIIALTANAMHVDIARCHAAGMDAHLAKPMTRAALTQAIARVLTARHGGLPGRRPCFDVLLLGVAGSPLDSGLKAMGHRVFAVPRDEAALAMLAARPFDMVVVSGGDPARMEAIRAAIAPCRPRPPLLVVADPVLRDSLLAAGADEVLSDTIAFADLAAAISTFFAEERLDVVLDAERLVGLRKLMLDGLREQVGRLAREGGNAEVLRQVAHRIKGSASNLRMSELAAVADKALRMGEDRAASIETLERARDMLCDAINNGIVELSGSIPPQE